MREIAVDDSHWVLYEDEATAALYLRAVCNQSAAYFVVDVALLPDEIVAVYANRTLAASGRALLDRLADRLQFSQARFADERRAAWQALGHAGEPQIPAIP